MRTIQVLSIALVTGLLADTGKAGTITLVGNGAGGGPIFVTSTSTSIGIGTRVRIGTFNEANMAAAVNAYLAGSADYTATFNSLNSNFFDLGTAVTNYGSSSQSAVGGAAFTPNTSQFGFNGTTSLSINGVTGSYSTFNGTITSVNYSLSVGASKNLYIWTAFNNEIGIVRNGDGTGTAAWITPTSDGANLTLNLSGLQATAGGVMQSSEVILGTIADYTSGSDLIRLAPAIPEPTSFSLVAITSALFLAALRRRKTSSVLKTNGV